MNVLIVYAHHEPASFSAALRDASVRALRGAGHHVDVSDLYAMQFDPVSDRRNFTTVFDPARLRQQAEEVHASTHGGFDPGLQAELDKLLRCDLLLLHFPLWWLGMPAILKGWIDRVFACGVVYGGGRYFDNGMLKGRSAMCVVTVGGTKQDYDASGRYATTIDAVLLPIHRGIFEFVGFRALAPFVAYAPGRISDAQRREYIESLRSRMGKLDGFAHDAA